MEVSQAYFSWTFKVRFFDAPMKTLCWCLVQVPSAIDTFDAVPGQVVAVSCGSQHSAAISQDSDERVLFTWGSNR